MEKEGGGEIALDGRRSEGKTNRPTKGLKDLVVGGGKERTSERGKMERKGRKRACRRALRVYAPRLCKNQE